MGRLKERLGLLLLGKTAAEVTTLEDQTRRIVQLELQWAETLDFIQHWAGRQAKRDAKAIKVKLGEPSAAATEEPPQQPLPVGNMHAVKAELRRRAQALGPGGIHLRTGSEP
jgi:hypothetical protein